MADFTWMMKIRNGNAQFFFLYILIKVINSEFVQAWVVKDFPYSWLKIHRELFDCFVCNT